MWFEPRKQKIWDITINSLWSLLAWLVWSIIIIIISFVLSDSMNIVSTFEKAKVWIKTSSIFPLVLSIITLFWTTVTSFLSYKIITLTSPENYKNNIVILWQIAFFQILTYIFLTPIYIYTWLISYDNIMLVYIFHVMVTIFGTSIILEILNNYRYILIWIYGSFIGLFASSVFTIIIFNSFSSWYAKLLSLVLLIPVINFSTTFFKQIFELAYYNFYKLTSQDKLWDIFYQIELEEKEALREEEEKNSI